MCTPSQKLPFGSRSIEIASSKSRACLAVDRHRLPAPEVGRALDVALLDGRARAASLRRSASSLCSSGRLYLRMMTAVSTPGASSRPSTSTTRPSAGRVAVGQRVISTVTISPRRAPRALALRHLHVHHQPSIERHDEPEPAVVDVVAADDALRRRARGCARCGPRRGRRPAGARRARRRGRRASPGSGCCRRCRCSPARRRPRLPDRRTQSRADWSTRGRRRGSSGRAGRSDGRESRRARPLATSARSRRLNDARSSRGMRSDLQRVLSRSPDGRPARESRAGFHLLKTSE